MDHPDTPDRFGACTCGVASHGAQAVSGLVQEKHIKAVRIITKAIAQGDMGADSIVYNDGGSASKWACAGVAELDRTRKDIPRDLISQEEFQGCKSRPDIIQYTEGGQLERHLKVNGGQLLQ